jgi:hypothetical protein
VVTVVWRRKCWCGWEQHHGHQVRGRRGIHVVVCLVVWFVCLCWCVCDRSVEIGNETEGIQSGVGKRQGEWKGRLIIEKEIVFVQY